jgi:large subunit ribosomal protein L24
MHIRVNDIVEVTAGDDKGKRGKVLRVDRPNNKVTVQGINLVYRHMKPSRVGARYNPDGSKELYAKKSGTLIRVLAKANPKYARKS